MKYGFLLLFVAAVSWAWPTIAQDRTSTLDEVDRLAGLATFWSEAKYNFAYFDKATVNWDSAYKAFIPQVLASRTTWDYYRTMQRFGALLKDGHTDINPPWSLYGYSTYVPFRFVVIDQKPIVSRVLKGLSDQVPIGSELLTINLQPTNQYLENEVFPYISASSSQERWNRAMFGFWSATSDTTTHYPMTFRAPNGKIINVTTRLFSQHERDGSAWLQGDGSTLAKWQLSRLTMLPGGIAHVELNSFDQPKIVEEFKHMLPQLVEAKAVIIDVRQNGGGNTGNGAEILTYFTRKPRLVGSMWRTREHRAAFKAWGTYYAAQPFDSSRAQNEFYQRALQTARGDFWYKGDTMTFDNPRTELTLGMPVVVLAGSSTASAAEDFLILVRQNTSIPILGEASMGTTGQPLSFSLPGGGSARICTKRDTYVSGEDFVGVGVKPDIRLQPSVASVMRGRDVVLEQAIAIVLSGPTALQKK